jgi:hypothetical protein
MLSVGRGEDTKRNLKHVKARRHDTLCNTTALDDGQDSILAQPEPMTNLPIRLDFARASGLNLLVAAIILWNTTYQQSAVNHLGKEGDHPAPR